MVHNLENELIRQYVKVFTPVNFLGHWVLTELVFGITAKIPLAPPASIAVKVNNSSLFRVSYALTLRLGVKLTLSALVDQKSFNAGGHKFGLALELEA